MKKISTIIFLAFTLSLAVSFPVFCRAQTINQPENMEEVKQLGEKALESVKKEAPGAIKKIWANEVLPVWKKMFIWAKESVWDNHLAVWLNNLWNNIANILKGEVEQRKEAIGEEFQKEKQEIKAEAPIVGKTIWEKLKELIK